MDAIERFEYMAELFHKETGLMAPGKDSPAAFGATDMEERVKKWGDWTEEFYSDLFLLYKNGKLKD